MNRFFSVSILMALFATCFLSAAENDVDSLHLDVDASIMVFDRVVASKALADWAEDKGGYFTWKSEESIRLRVPDEAVAGFRSMLEESCEAVIRFDQSTWDMRENLLNARSALEAREEVLAKNLEYLDTSDVEGTLELEKEIRRLMSEIDGYRGYIRKLEHDRSMATIQVSLSFQQSTVPINRPSNFPWINSVDFFQFMRISMRNGSLFGPTPISIPDGFAEVKRRPEWIAMSPEGIRLRVRSVKNYPEQSLDFWKKSLISDLAGRGYLRIDSISVCAWDERQPFENTLWAVPWGNEDYLYLVSLRLNGSEIEILEMAGAAEYMSGYLKE